jgi:hypothetical protein
MIAIHPDLLTIIDAVEIHSLTRFALRGQIRDMPVPSPGGATSDSPEIQALELVEALQTDLYRSLYIRPTTPPIASIPDAVAQRELIAALSAANTGRGAWESGWLVHGLDEEGRVAVTKNDLTLWTSPWGLRVRESEIRKGQSCQVRVGKELRNRIPGFYFAIGDGSEGEEGGSDGTEPMVRYYWHLTREAAVPFTAAATGLLNAAEIPFLIKVVADPGAYLRADAGVLFLPKRYPRSFGSILRRIHENVVWGLRPDVPLFTKPLAHGLGLAEDPPGHLSFGEQRCKLVATALWRSFVRGATDRVARAAMVAAVFEEVGLDPTRPYLSPGSDDDYSLGSELGETSPPVPSVYSTQRVSESSPSYRPRADALRPSASFIEAAAGIGHALCRQAIWDVTGRLCNWMGRSSSRDEGHPDPNGLTSTALASWLYDGSAGIALFLAQLHAQTGDADFRRTALGAMHRSIRQVDRSPASRQSSPLSFFLGHLGLAYAARRVGALTEEAELHAPVDSILDRVIEAPSTPHRVDVVGGNAGAIPALLALGRMPGLKHCRELAIALGEELCRCALRQGNTCAWMPDAVAGPGTAATPLTGLAHGAAGIGLALFELHAITGRLDFLETARAAFRYEDSLFDHQTGNWPDQPPVERSDADSAAKLPRSSVAWCRGAAGIALTRLRAASLDQAHREDNLASARTAIATTLDAIDEQLIYSRADATPCHGLTGLTEIVWIAGEILDDPMYRDRALTVGRALIDRHAAPGDWPSGVPSGGPNPSLMIGTAGVGYTFLRLHDPEGVPSILLLTA